MLELRAGGIVPLVREIGNPGRIFKPKHVAEREKLVDKTGGIGVVLLDAQLGLVIQQAIEYTDCVPDSCALITENMRGELVREQSTLTPTTKARA